MQKIISLYVRNYDGDRLVRDELVPGAEWVANGEGIATRKWDGTCCLVQDGKLFKRYDAKRGKTPPNGFIPAQDPDLVTGHWPGWIQVGGGEEDKWHREGLENWYELMGHSELSDGTYELCGPKIQGNPEGLALHYLIKHGLHELPKSTPRSFDGLKEYLNSSRIEGIVWHHPDGRMVKIKGKDFGLLRKEKST